MPPSGTHFLLDENVPIAVAIWMRDLWPNWKVDHTSEVGLDARPDREIFQWAQDNQAIVITFDEDFADLRAFPVGHAGVIRLRVWPTTIEETQDALTRLFAEVSVDEIEGALVIVDRTKIRIRS